MELLDAAAEGIEDAETASHHSKIPAYGDGGRSTAGCCDAAALDLGLREVVVDRIEMRMADQSRPIRFPREGSARAGRRESPPHRRFRFRRCTSPCPAALRTHDSRPGRCARSLRRRSPPDAPAIRNSCRGDRRRSPAHSACSAAFSNGAPCTAHPAAMIDDRTATSSAAIASFGDARRRARPDRHRHRASGRCGRAPPRARRDPAPNASARSTDCRISRHAPWRCSRRPPCCLRKSSASRMRSLRNRRAASRRRSPDRWPRGSSGCGTRRGSVPRDRKTSAAHLSIAPCAIAGGSSVGIALDEAALVGKRAHGIRCASACGGCSCAARIANLRRDDVRLLRRASGDATREQQHHQKETASHDDDRRRESASNASVMIGGLAQVRPRHRADSGWPRCACIGASASHA